jgi:hypothetical protein
MTTLDGRIPNTRVRVHIRIITTVIIVIVIIIITMTGARCAQSRTHCNEFTFDRFHRGSSTADAAAVAIGLGCEIHVIGGTWESMRRQLPSKKKLTKKPFISIFY